MKQEELIDKIIESIRPFEFRTLVIGFKRPEIYDRKSHEAAFRALKIALGDEITRRMEGVEVDFEHPDLRVEIDDRFDLSLTTAPIFIGGRYRKLSREIPASRWIHHACRGRGCPSCSHTGSLCGPSVEELLAAPALACSGGRKALFHALGREDTDARMLGSGRPFVLEVQGPVRRTLPLDRIAAEFADKAHHLAEVMALTHTDRLAVPAVKGAAAEKTYRTWLRIEGSVPPDAADRAQALAGRVVHQLSPRRVMHRRGSEICRTRRIVESEWAGEIEGRFVWEIRVESGMYIKELVSSDGGRTRPSLTEVLGMPCVCEALDVLEIHWDPPWEARPLNR